MSLCCVVAVNPVHLMEFRMMTRLATFAFALCLLLFLGLPPAHGNVDITSRFMHVQLVYDDDVQLSIHL